MTTKYEQLQNLENQRGLVKSLEESYIRIGKEIQREQRRLIEMGSKIDFELEKFACPDILGWYPDSEGIPCQTVIGNYSPAWERPQPHPNTGLVTCPGCGEVWTVDEVNRAIKKWSDMFKTTEERRRETK